MKICAQCGETKERNEFARDMTSSDLKSPHCIICSIELRRATRATNSAARRIRGFGLAEVNTPEEREAVITWRKTMRVANLPCLYCCSLIDYDNDRWTEDHKVPISQGGRDTVDNVVPCCEPCNLPKGVKDADTFLGSLWGTAA